MWWFPRFSSCWICVRFRRSWRQEQNILQILFMIMNVCVGFPMREREKESKNNSNKLIQRFVINIKFINDNVQRLFFAFWFSSVDSNGAPYIKWNMHRRFLAFATMCFFSASSSNTKLRHRNLLASYILICGIEFIFHNKIKHTLALALARASYPKLCSSSKKTTAQISSFVGFRNTLNIYLLFVWHIKSMWICYFDKRNQFKKEKVTLNKKWNEWSWVLKRLFFSKIVIQTLLNETQN